MNYKLRIATLCILLCSSCIAVRSQRLWTLQECIAYAMEHNTQVLQDKLQIEKAGLQLNSSRMSRLPDLNASMGQGFGFGRSQGRDGRTEDNTSANTNFGIYTSVPLFTALRIPNQVKSDRENLRSAEQQLEARKRQLAISVTTYYLNVLYYSGLAEVAQEQVAVDSMLLEQTRTLVSEGRKAESEALQAEAQLASSRLQKTTAEGNLRNATLDLMLAVNYDEEEDVRFAPVPPEEVVAIQARLLASDKWIQGGISAHPNVLAAEHQLKSSEYSLRATRSAYFPTLSFSAGYNTGYFHSYNYQNLPFGRQLNLNGSESVSLSLNIPIFNRFSTRNNVKRAELEIQNQKLQLDETRRQLRRQIQQARTDALNAIERLASAETAERANAAAFQCEQDKYAAGTATIYSLGQAQQRLSQARNDVVQARTELQLRLQLLQYYE